MTSNRKNSKNGLFHLLEYNVYDSRMRNKRKKFSHVKYAKELTRIREVSGWEPWRINESNRKTNLHRGFPQDRQ